MIHSETDRAGNTHVAENDAGFKRGFWIAVLLPGPFSLGTAAGVSLMIKPLLRELRRDENTGVLMETRVCAQPGIGVAGEYHKPAYQGGRAS
jgi:hypothetical protein